MQSDRQSKHSSFDLEIIVLNLTYANFIQLVSINERPLPAIWCLIASTLFIAHTSFEPFKVAC